MKAGPKRQVTAPALDLSHLPPSGAKRVDAFCRDFLKVPRGKGAKETFRLRPWQVQIVRGLVPARGQRPVRGVVVMPRGNGKSGLAAVLAAYHLFADNVEGAEVLCVATNERQAGITFGRVRRMIELSPQLSAQCQIYKDRIVVPSTDSSLLTLPSEPDALQGYSPSFACVDELEFVREETWEAVTLACGKNERSQVFGISTPGDTHASVLRTLVRYGREHPEDKGFYLREFAAPESCAIDDERAWEIANPALNDFLKIEPLRHEVLTTRQSSFRRFRLGQWVENAGAWLPAGVWDECEDSTRQIVLKEPVVLFLDGSFNDDSTALLGCTVNRPHHLFVVQMWEKPPNARDDWRVPRDELNRTVDQSFRRWNVQELAADPYMLRSEIEAWAKRYGNKRVLVYPTSTPSRMGPATERMTAAVLEQTVTHDGNPALASHVANAVVKFTRYGDVITKEKSKSAKKIDAAVSAIGALDRAALHANATRPRRNLKVVGGTW